MTKTLHGIGLISGTSMDGVDLCYAGFTSNKDEWEFEILATECIPYSEQWHARLAHLPEQSAEIFAKSHVYYGKYLGQLLKDFISKNNLTQVDFISSHGQTIFHNPEKRYTIQIGSGAEIAAATGIPTVSDLRSSDVALGGQGAPIVPLGEKFLFTNYSCFINIGGISNISIHTKNKVIGYDVCMGNLLLDYFAQQHGKQYDFGGQIARSGIVNEDLFDSLNKNSYFDEAPPKSLDAAEVIQENLAIIQQFDIVTQDIMATIVSHIAHQLSNQINKFPIERVLLTGGGALNDFLVQKIQEKSKAEIVVPETNIIEFKEALIMAFLGLKRILKQTNVLASVTGANKDSINGAINL